MSQSTRPDPVRQARSRLALAHRFGGDETKIAAARASMTEAKVERAIQTALEAAPPLTDEQRTRLAAILTGGGVR